MAAEFDSWTGTLADPADEAAFRTEQAATLRRNGLVAAMPVVVGNLISLIVEPLMAIRSAELWPLDLSRLVVLVIGNVACIQLWRRHDPAISGTWLPVLWTAMMIDMAMSNAMDRQMNTFDGFGGLFTLLMLIGFGGFSAICAIDFRWTLFVVGGTTATFVLTTLSGHQGSDLLARNNTAMMMMAAAMVILPISHGLRRGTRQAFTALLRERRLVAQVEAARAAAEQANRVKTQFVATMSHEFRTPLNAMLGMAELLAETPLSRRQRQYVDMLGMASDHLAGLVGDILDYSRIEADRLILEAVPVSPSGVVREVIDLLGSEALAKGLALDAVIAPEVPHECRGDPLRLRQILLNLAGNAIRVTDRGGIVLRVDVVDDGSGALRFAVEDTGPGVTAEVRASIFEPFIQANDSAAGRPGGLGLGLAISRRLVELMGGRLWLEDRAGGGSRFLFTVALPVLAGEPDALPDTGRARPDSEPESASESAVALRVLLADDSEMNRLVTVEHLKLLPITVDVAADGAAALARFEAGRYDVVLLDIRMPVLDGLAAARAMRRLEAEQGRLPIPIIALTAGALWEEREAALAAGCTGFLAKPLRRQMLFRVLAEQMPGLTFPLAVSARTADEADPVGRFLAAAPARLARLRSAIGRDDRDDVTALAHGLRGDALVTGLEPVAARLMVLEQAAATGALLEMPLREVEAVVEGLSVVWTPHSPPEVSPPAAEPDGLPRVRVMLAEDQILVREGIRSLLAADPRLEVVAEVGDGLACVRSACRLNPEVVIVDLMMPHMAGSEVIAEIKRRRPEIKVLVLTAVMAPEPLLTALRVGADGLLHKGAARTELFEAITAVRAGTLYLSQGLPLAVTGRSAIASTVALTLRERQVLKLLVEGRRNREIGDLLAISTKTVEKHRASLMKKLGTNSAAALAGLALRYGLIETADAEMLTADDPLAD